MSDVRTGSVIYLIRHGEPEGGVRYRNAAALELIATGTH
jgi:hypothetical protein